MWRVIGFSTDSISDLEQETQRVIELLENDTLTYFHIRKPLMDIKQTRCYLSSFPMHLRERIALHDYYELAKSMDFGGITINSRNASYNLIKYKKMRISYSCHNLQEISLYKERASFLFLSPIFNSISKPNYKSILTLGELQQAKDKGIIDEKVIALGGVIEDRFDVLKVLGFGGAALYGAIWND
jgi:thiamine-phosphate pyrophosphorylase